MTIHARGAFRLALPLLWLALIAVPGARAQAVDDGEREFHERISVMAVEIPVRVMVGGSPVAGLDAASFRVFEEGVEREVVGFEVVDLSRPAVAEPDSSPPYAESVAPKLAGEGRRIVLLFDIAYSSRKHLLRGVAGARRLLEPGLHRADRVAVATYSEARGIVFVTGFSSDRRTTTLALEAVAAGVGGDRKAHREAMRSLAERTGRARSPLDRFRRLTAEFGQSAAIAFESAEADLGVGVRAGGGGGGVAEGADGSRFGRAQTSFDAGRSYQTTSPAEIAAGLARGPGRSGVRALSLALVEMATVLRDLPGQRHLFLLSEGFAPGLLQDSTALFHLEKALEALRRSNWAIQAIDIEGVPEAAASALGAHGLFYLANETGGELIANHNDLELAATKLVARTAVSYVLTIQPTDIPADGRYRPLEVRLAAEGPRRARVIHRPGYYAPKPRGQRNALENTMDAAALLLSGRDSSGLDVGVLALPLAGGDLAQVPVVVEVAADELGAPGRRGVSLEVHGYALDRAGAIQDLFSQSLRLSRKDVDRLRDERSGLRFFDRLALPAGDFDLRMLVRNLSTGATHLSTLPLSVPGRVEPALAGPLFVPDDDWAVLRGEGNLNGGRGFDHPFVLAGRPRIPTLEAVFAPGESSIFFLKTQGLEAPDLRIRARVVDGEGRAVDGGELRFDERVVDGERIDALLGTFTARGLEPGRYRLEVVASWDGGTRQRVGGGEFRVVVD